MIEFHQKVKNGLVFGQLENPTMGSLENYVANKSLEEKKETYFQTKFGDFGHCAEVALRK